MVNLEDKNYVRRLIEAAIRIGILVALVAWCFAIVRPFAVIIIWGIILAVALYPLYAKLRSALGERRKLAATICVLFALAILLVPTYLFLGSVTETGLAIAKDIRDGTMELPPPPEGVKDWPFIGEKLSNAWAAASEDEAAALERYAPHLKTLGKGMVGFVTGMGLGALQFAVSIILAGVFLATSAAGARAAHAVGKRLAEDQGEELADLSAATVRSVAQGVVGVAAIQATLGGAGMLLASVPGAGLWALLILILAIIQLPPLLVLGPAIIYVFAKESTTTAVIFMIWGILISCSDAVLKPLLMGRGVKAPMLVILIGAIGGMMSMGILGLFIGAVVLAVGYQLFQLWLKREIPETAEAATPSEA
ncbi:MAG: AI-2E family transporter [Planctomycetota bacterium]|jgi:predicted PurR-regulated permease PerM